eukprot:gene451-814_t
MFDKQIDWSGTLQFYAVIYDYAGPKRIRIRDISETFSDIMSEEKVEKPTEQVSHDFSLQKLTSEVKNPRGIPTAIFIEDETLFLEQNKTSVESALGALNELYSKYKYMETSFEKSKNVYKSKIPDIEQTLELIKLLKEKENDDEDLIANYSLCDTIFAKAKLSKEEGVVYLWIGADTMVEYTYDEAIELLELQLKNSFIKIEELNEDLNFLRGNSITVEVNMARLFNYNVKLKKVKAAADLASTK